MLFAINKGPKFIHLDLTGACNLRCIHCRATSKPNPSELNINEIITFLNYCKREFPNWEKLFIGGGEPLLREKDLFKIMEHVNNLGIKCSLNTNGTLINNQNVVLIKRFIKIVQISLDGASPGIHDRIRGVEGSFKKSMKGIDILLKNNIKVCLRMTLNNINYIEAFELIDLALKKGVKAVSYYRVLPVGRAKKYNISIDKKIYYIILKELMRQKYMLKGKLDIISRDPLKVIMDSRLKAEILKKYDVSESIGGCLPGIVEIFINNVGDIYPCTMLPIFLGNIKKEPLKKIWNNSKFLLKLRNRKYLKGNCKKCFLQRICGGCRAAAFGEYGDYFEEDPYCPRSFNSTKRKMKKDEKLKTINSPCQSC